MIGLTAFLKKLSLSLTCICLPVFAGEIGSDLMPNKTWSISHESNQLNPQDDRGPIARSLIVEIQNPFNYDEKPILIKNLSHYAHFPFVQNFLVGLARPGQNFFNLAVEALKEASNIQNVARHLITIHDQSRDGNLRSLIIRSLRNWIPMDPNAKQVMINNIYGNNLASIQESSAYALASVNDHSDVRDALKNCVLSTRLFENVRMRCLKSLYRADSSPLEKQFLFQFIRTGQNINLGVAAIRLIGMMEPDARASNSLLSLINGSYREFSMAASVAMKFKLTPEDQIWLEQ